MTALKKISEAMSIKYGYVFVFDNRDATTIRETLSGMDERWVCETFTMNDAGLVLVEFSMSENALFRTVRRLEKAGFMCREMSDIGCIIRLYHVEESH